MPSPTPEVVGVVPYARLRRAGRFSARVLAVEVTVIGLWNAALIIRTWIRR